MVFFYFSPHVVSLYFQSRMCTSRSNVIGCGFNAFVPPNTLVNELCAGELCAGEVFSSPQYTPIPQESGLPPMRPTNLRSKSTDQVFYRAPKQEEGLTNEEESQYLAIPVRGRGSVQYSSVVGGSCWLTSLRTPENTPHKPHAGCWNAHAGTPSI